MCVARDSYCTRGVEMRIAIANEAETTEIISLLTNKLNIELKKKLVRCYVWSIGRPMDVEIFTKRRF